MTIRTRIRPIGTSLGVIIPKRELEVRRLREGDVVEIPKLAKPAARDLFGIWKERPARLGEATP